LSCQLVACGNYQTEVEKYRCFKTEAKPTKQRGKKEAKEELPAPAKKRGQKASGEKENGVAAETEQPAESKPGMLLLRIT